jgi:dihydroneopterin aldolase
MAMSDEQQASAGHYREIAEKIRQLARQTRIAVVQEELSDLADELDRMAESLSKGVGLGGRDNAPRERLEQCIVAV